jgi:hypothetical protein
MDGSIEQMLCRYHVFGSRDAAGVVAARFDRLAREHVPSMLSEALDYTFADDQTVYVVRRVAARAGFRLRSNQTDEQVAQRWSANLAGAIVRTIAGDVGDGNVVRFADQSDYVAHFVEDLLRGTAWDRWFYQPLSALRARHDAETLLAVLLDNRPHLPEILGRLHRSGAIPLLLAAIGAADARRLWESGLTPAIGEEPEALRPLFAAAIELVGRLGVWSQPRPTPERLFQAYLATRPAPADWRDRRGLAAALLAILRFLAQRGELRWPIGPAREQIPTRLDQALADLDWLDVEWLGAAITVWAIETQAGDLGRPGREAAKHSRASLAEMSLEAAALARAGTNELPEGSIPAVQIEWDHKKLAAQHALISGALSLIDQLGIWDQPPPSLEALFQAYLATGPALPGSPDRATLAGMLDSILSFLSGHRHLRQVTAPEREHLLAQLDQVAATIGAARAGEQAPIVPGAAPASQLATPDLPTRPAGLGPTPRQHELMANLAHVLPGTHLNRVAPTSAANALQLYAALIDHAPRWAGDPLATRMIQRLLEAWSWIERGGSADEILRQVQHGSTRQALAANEQAAGLLAGLGDPGMAPIAQLRRYSQATRPPVPQASAALHPRSAPTIVETNCAGVFLLLRAAIDARLPALLAGCVPERRAADDALAALLAAVGLRWAGPAGLLDGRLDPGLALLAGLDGAAGLDTLREALAAIDYIRLQYALLDVLAGQRLLSGSEVYLYQVRLPDATSALVAGNAEQRLWPLGQALTAAATPAAACADWLAAWESATGRRPTLIVDEPLRAMLPEEIQTAGLVVARASDAGGEDTAYWPGQDALAGALQALWAGWPALPDADLSITLLAGALLRLWARWLRKGFDASSAPYLLDNFIRRPGRILADETSITIEMQSRALDVVVEMAGYMADLEQVPWLGQRRVRFRVRG